MQQGQGQIQRAPILGISPEKISSMVNRDVVEQHIEEAAFQWLQHVRAVSRPDYSLEDLAELDSYIDANLDGVYLGGEIAWDICQNMLGDEEYLFPATILAIQHNRVDWLQQILDIVDEDNEQAFIGALSWLKYTQAEPFIRMLLQHNKTYFNYLGICACISHRCIPSDMKIESYLNQDVVILKCAVIQLIGRLKLQQYRKHLHCYLVDSNVRYQFESACALSLTGERIAAIPILKKLATISSPSQLDALQILLRIVDEQSQKQLINDFILSGNLKIANRAIGIAGYIDFVPWLLTAMEQTELARLAGEAFSMITGVDLDYEDLTKEDEDELEKDDDQDDEEFDEYEKDLPDPSPVLVAQWWQQYQPHFNQGVRYLAGKGINEGNLYDILSHAYQRQRDAAALELALLSHENFFVETHCRAKNQVNLVVKIGGNHG